jgi:hypothetical protein
MFFNYTGLEHWCVYKITYDMYGESPWICNFVLLLTSVVLTHNIFVQNIYLMHIASLQTLHIALQYY